jgi:peroxiredoxin|tara:strand:+ start:123 stop:737 length:615 start_codon:yes stop_codon:yes gene_type:complete
MSELNTNFPKAILKKHVKAVDGISRWVDIDTLELAEDRKIVVFGLPGAFTPTCSSQQLPGFEKLYHEFRKAGIDDIFCVSVNDTFVMNEWALDQGLVNVKLLPDGSGEFTVKMGMDVRKDNLGFGMRSWRYAAVYDNGLLVWSGVEQGYGDNFEGDPYDVSKPENVLDNVKAFGWPSVTETLGEEGREIELNFSETTDVKETFS